MIKPYDIIKHKEFKDVCCEVVRYYKDKAVVKWINLGQEQSWYISVEQQEIKLDNLNDWLICSDTEKKCLRDSEWKELQRSLKGALAKAKEMEK